MFVEMDTRSLPRIGSALWSGLRRRSPRCHQGALFIKRRALHERCPECDYPLATALEDLVVLTYIGSASITGLFLLAVFVVRMPANGFEMLIYLLVTFGVLFGTMQHRKGFAIALVYAHNLLAGEEVETGDAEPKEG